MSIEEENVKVVFDTNVIIAFAMWQGSAYKIAHRIHKHVEIFTSKDILEETREVLHRDFKLSENDIEDKISSYLALCKLIDNPKITVSVVANDPDDNKIIDCAIEARADYIVSYDHHLLDLKVFENIKILKPEDLLKELNL